MFNKGGIRVLLFIACGLLLVWALRKWSERKDGGNTVRSSVLALDTARVRSFSIYPKRTKHIELRFERNGHEWTVGDTGAAHPADNASIQGLLGGFSAVRTLRLAGRMEHDAAKYQLGDTASSRITIRLEGQDPITLRTGLVDMETSSAGVTYVNVEGEPEIHAIAGTLTRTLDSPMNNWRDHVLIGGDPHTWTKVSITLGGTEGYTLQRTGAGWALDGMETNTARMEQFLEALSKGSSSRYVDDAKLDGLSPGYRLVIQDNHQEPLIAEVFDLGDKLVLRNSRRPQNLFWLDRERDMGRLMRPAAYLLELQPVAP